MYILVERLFTIVELITDIYAIFKCSQIIHVRNGFLIKLFDFGTGNIHGIIHFGYVPGTKVRKLEQIVLARNNSQIRLLCHIVQETAEIAGGTLLCSFLIRCSYHDLDVVLDFFHQLWQTLLNTFSKSFLFSGTFFR